MEFDAQIFCGGWLAGARVDTERTGGVSVQRGQLWPSRSLFAQAVGFRAGAAGGFMTEAACS